MVERYFVDARVGCVAVRDRERTNPKYNGLHNDTPGVVAYWHGTKNSSGDWEVSQEYIAAANRACVYLNTTTKIAVSKE